MKSVFFTAIIILFLFLGNAFAQTCYDRRYGYYECDPSYSSYPDQGQTFIEGAILGIFLGGFLNSRDYEGSGHWGRGHEHGHDYRNHHHH